MHIFRTIILLILAVQLFGQSNSIVIDDVDTLTVKTYYDVSNKLDSLLYSSDNIGEYFELSRINSDNLIIYNKYYTKVILDTLIFRNNDELRTSILNQIFKSLIGTKPTSETIKIFNSIINSAPFFENTSTIQFGINKKNKLGALIDIKSNFNNYFSGLIGASRSDEQKWAVNGQIEIHLENQWKTANIIDLHWKRFDEESQILNLIYEEPHPLGLPIGVSVAYNQDLRDGNYVTTNSAFGIIKTIPNIGKLGFGGKNTKINSTAKGDSSGFSNLTTKSIYIDGVINYRNDYWIPTRGFFVSLHGDIGKRKVNNYNTVIMSGYAKIEKYIFLGNKNNITLKIFGNSNWVSSGKLHAGELIKYGGINTLRGYAEDYFKSDWVISQSIEYNFKIGKNQQISMFSDIALQDTYKPFPIGYGFGFTQVTKNSVLKMYYGLGRNDSIKKGKIHLQFLTRL